MLSIIHHASMQKRKRYVETGVECWNLNAPPGFFLWGEMFSKKPCLYPTPDFPYLCAFRSSFLESICLSYSRYRKRIYVLCVTIPTGIRGSHNFKRWWCFLDGSVDTTSWVWDINQWLPGSLVWPCHKAGTVKSQNNTFQEEDYFSFKVCFWGGGECK